MYYARRGNHNKSPGMSIAMRFMRLTFPPRFSQWLSPANDVSQKGNYAYATYGMSANKHGETSQNAGD